MDAAEIELCLSFFEKKCFKKKQLFLTAGAKCAAPKATSIKDVSDVHH